MFPVNIRTTTHTHTASQSFNVAEFVFCRTLCVHVESAQQVQRLFAGRFPVVKVPACETICKFLETGSVRKRKQKKKKFLMVETLNDIAYNLKSFLKIH